MRDVLYVCCTLYFLYRMFAMHAVRAARADLMCVLCLLCCIALLTDSFYNDPDQLMIGNNGLSLSESEAQMGMWALFSAPMIMSVELRNRSMASGKRERLSL